MKSKFFSNQKLKISIAIITIALIISSVIVNLVSNKKIGEEMSNLAEKVKLSAATFNSYSEKIEALSSEQTKAYLYTLDGWKSNGRKRSYMSNYGRTKTSYNSDGTIKEELEPKWLFMDRFKELNDLYCVRSGTDQDDRYLVLDLYNLSSDENGLAIVKEMFATEGDATGENSYKHFMWILENMYSIADDTSEIQVNSEEWQARFEELLYKIAKYRVDNNKVAVIEGKTTNELIQDEYTNLSEMYKKVTNELTEYVNPSDEMKATSNANGTNILPITTQTTETAENEYTGNTMLSMVYNLYNSWSEQITDEKPEINHYKTATIEARQALVRTIQNYALLAMVNQTDGQPRQKYNITDNGVIDGKISTVFIEEYSYKSKDGTTKTGKRTINREIEDSSDTKKFISYLYDYLIYGYETQGTNYDVNKYKNFTLDGGYEGKVSIEKSNLEGNRTSYNKEQNKIGPFSINNKYNYDVELKVLKGEEPLSYTIQDTNGNTVTNISNLGTAEFNIVLNQDYELTDESEIKIKYNVNYGKVPQAVLLYPVTENNEDCRYQSMINLKKSPKTDSGELTVGIKIQNIDLALKKVITKVNNVELKGSIPEYEAGVRFKEVNTDKLANKTETTAQYIMNKTPVKVRVGDIVTYEIKIYNEGNTKATASEIQDYIPTGLQAKRVKYGENVWENNVGSIASSDENNYVMFDNQNNNITIRYLSQLDLIEAYNKDTKTIDSETIIVECEVLPEATGVLTNIAQISQYTTEDENNTRIVVEKDIDSESDNWTISTSDRNSNTWKNYSNSQSNWLDNNDHEFKGQQDDDDFEKVIVEKFDLSLTKEIKNVEREEQNVYSNLNRLRNIDTTNLENETKSTASYYMNKQPVEVMPNDIVTYKLRIYNEGKIDGVVKEVTDYLPTGLTFVDLVDEYKTENGGICSINTEKTTQDKVVIKIGQNDEGKTIPAYTNSSEMLKTSITVELKCKVESQENYDIELFNVAEITNYGYLDNNGNYKETSTKNVDIDSMENTILTDTNSTTTQEIINEYKTKITNTINKYEENGIVDKTNLHYEDDDDFERLIVKNAINPIFDLSLRKFITKVQTTDSKGNEIVIETPNRYPYVNSYSILKLEQINTAEYYHDKLKVQVNEGDLVTYKIRIYNEGGKLDYSGYAKEITDYLPTGLTFIDLVDEYKTENGGKYTLTQYNEEENKVIITYDGSEIIKPESIYKIITSQTGAYQEVGLVCKVNTGTRGKLLTNRAEITKDVAGEYNSENSFVIVNNETEESIDRDSRPNTIKTVEKDPDLDNWYWNEIGSEDLPKSYYPGVQDDDDFETVYVRNRKFDLSLRKFITKVNGIDVEKSREPQIEVRSQTLLSQKGNAAYYHKKGKVEVGVGDEVEYTIRVYNEGTVNNKTGQKDYAGYAGEITDYLPDGLKFVKIADKYDKANGGKYELTKYDETQNKVVISYDGTQEILPNSINRIILRYTNELLNKECANEGTVGKEKTLYQEVAVICKVEESESTVLTNRAEITKYMCESNEYSTSVRGDIDSEPSIETTGLNLTNWYYLNVDEQTDQSDKFYPGVQDDDDFDTVHVSNLYTGTQLELNKIGTSTGNNIEGAIFNIQKNTESKMVLKTFNKSTMQELEKNDNGYVTIPKDGAILDMQNLKYGGTYEIEIQEIQAPDGYEKIFENIILQISVSKEGTITAKIKTVNGEEYTVNSNKIVELVNANEQGEVTLSAKQKDYTIQYRKGENGEWEEYNAQTKAIIEKNTTVYGISVDENGNYSKMGIKEITNIDKIKPTIEKAEEKSSGDIETAISLTIKDTQTEEYGASGIQWYGLSKTQNDEPTQKISGNGETIIENAEINEISENGTYYIWVKDIAGNITKQEIEITGVATDVMVARIVSSSNTSLVGTEYGTLAAALQAVEADGTATIEILHEIYNEANSITENKNITIDLKGYTIQSRSSSKPVLEIENGSSLNIINPSTNTGGIKSVNNNGIVINEGGTFTLGTDDNSIILSQPRILAKENGVINNNGTFNFFDGQIEAITSIKGNVTETPVLYSVAVSQGEKTQVATLNIISNVEARIGKKTYTTLESAVEDANTAIGTDGSQVEIVVVTDLAKTNTVVINENKNIKLNLDGHSVTTTSTGNVFNNYGKLEIVDTSEEKTGKVYSTTNDVIQNNETTYKGTEKISWNNIKNKSTELGFVEQNGKLVPTNTGVSSSEAEGVIEINLIGKTGKYLLGVNAQVSSQSNNDYGYATITNSIADVPYSQTEGRFMLISGTISARDYTTYLEGGSKYYLHLGYRKNANTDTGDDKVTINNIYMVNLDENGYKLDLSTVEGTNEYGFDYNAITQTLVSNNKNVPNSTAYGTLKLDLTNKQGICNIIVNAEINCNSYNYGYVIVRNTSNPVSYSSGEQDGQIFKINRTVTDGYYNVSLAGGQVYYLQLGYYKNGDRNTGSDALTVKNIWVQEKNAGELTLTSGTIDIVKNSSTSSRYNCGILNTGILNINGATITSTSTGYYKNGVLNDKAGITVMNSGNITGNLQGIGNVSFNNSKEIGKVVVNGGTISTNYDGIDSNAFIGNVIINDGVFNSSSYQVYTTNRSNVVINGGTFGSNSNNSRLIYINSSNSVVEVNGGTFNSTSYCFYYRQAGKVVINNGTIQSNGTSTIYLDSSSNGIVEINGGNIKSINSSVIDNDFNTGNTQTKGAQIKITGGTLISESTNSNYYGVIWSYAEPNNIKITGGNLQSFDSTVYMVDYSESYSTKGTLEITGGNIESLYSSAVHIAAKNIELTTIGTKDGNINKNEPKLKGAVHAIYSPRANVNFYDGQLIAPQNQVISGQINEIEENSELVSEIKEDNLEKITLGEPEPVAKIGENTYSTLQQAINSCSTEAGDNVTTIEILRNFNMANQAVISEGQNIKINLNNKNMYVYSANSAILNNGKLEITDTPNTYNNTYSSLINNGTYYFENIENIFTSNNNGIANSTASSYVEIDLTNKPVAEYTLTVNAEISSETNCDIGFATVKEKLETPNYSDTTGRFIYISGEIVAKDYTTVLQGGKKYYLYLGYRKDGYKDTGNDVFKINSININGGITGVINSTGATILSNNSNATISDINMKFSATGSYYKWLNNIINSGNLVINSGKIVTNGKYTRGIYNTGVLNINGGLIDNGNNSNTRCIQNNDEGSVNIANGVIKSNYNSNIGSGIYNIYNDSTNDIVIGDTNQQNNPEITLNYGTGIYNNNSGNIIINSGKIVSANGYGIQNKSTGNVNVKNATIDTSCYSIQEDGDSNIIVENSNITSRYGNSSGTAIYLSKGNLEVKSGSINGYYGIFVNSSDSEVTINEGTVTGRDYGIYANYGKVTIYNGNISGTNGTGIYLGHSSIVQLGEKDGTVSTTIPSIYGKEIGVNIASSSASFNFYDGIIEGKESKSITGTVNDKETGYEVKKTVENSRETAILEEQFIAKVESTGTTYKNIQDAVDNTQNTDKITIINSTSLGNTVESIKIPAEKEITLDLAGFTIEAINNTTFENKGKLTIIDSSEQKTGNIYATGANGIILNTENGNLNLESGTLKIKSSGKAVYNTGSGTVTVNGGNISSTESGYGIFNESTGDVNIQSGNIVLKRSNNVTRAVYNNGSGKVNVTGGYIYVSTNSGDYTKAIENINGTIDVSGGEIKGEDTITNSSNGIVKVSNGTITSTGWNADAIKNNGGNVEVTGGTLINTNQGTSYTGSVICTDGGTLNITGGILTGGDGIETRNDAVVNITGGEIYAKGGNGIDGYVNGNISFENAKIESYGSGIYSQGADSGTNIIIKSGTITSSNAKAINLSEYNNVNLIIGEENSISSPNITGATGYYAIWNPSGSISYYNGTITGGTIVCGAFDNIPNGKEVILTQNENTETAVLGDIQDIVKIGEKTYSTLQSAIDECEENVETTIIVNKNFVISRSVEIPSNKKVTLDLNGNTIRTYARNYSILNNGTLNIVDNTENKTGAIIDRGARCIIKNTGILNIQEGNFKMHQGFSQKMIYNTENGSINVNGGDLYIYESSGVYNNRCYSYVIYSDSTGNINVQGGTIRLDKYDEYTYMYGIYNVSPQINTITFNNATIQNEKSNVGYTYGIYNKNDANVNILGGSIKMYKSNGNSSGNYCVYMSKGTLNATGGTISGGTGIYNYGNATFENISISSIYGIANYGTGTININNGTTINCGNESIYTNHGTVNIYGGSIESTNDWAIDNNYSSGVVNIYDGTIKSNNGVAIKNSGTVNITGGTVESTAKSAIQNVNSATLTIGDNQYPVSKESPVITGATYGVENSSGTFNFYDGIITGKTKAISGSVTNIPELYKVVYSENNTIATLDINAQFDQVASVNGVYYDTLQSAINAASSNGKIILHKNIVLNSQITIEQSANVTINLATYSISYAGENSAIVNNGNLTIINYNEEEQKEIEDADITISAEVKNINGIAITNNGTLTIGMNNGTVSKLSPAITGTPTAITNNGTLNLYDGTLNGEEITPGTQTANTNLYKLAKAEIMKAPAQVLTGKEVNYISVPSITQNPTEWTNQDVTVTIENTNRLILNIKNREKGFDLALRKYITSVNGKEPTTSRNPVINEYAVQGIKETGTAYYKHTKEALVVQTENIVVYRMSIYNEGEISGYAKEITDYLPAGLEYIADNELNQKYGWQVSTVDETTGKATSIKTNYLQNTLIQADENSNTLTKIINNELTEAPYVEVACKVTAVGNTTDTTKEYITNRAEITVYGYNNESNEWVEANSKYNVETNNKVDKDSEEKTIETNDLRLSTWYVNNVLNYKPQIENYYPGEQDDDDFETVYVEECVEKTVTKQWKNSIYNEENLQVIVGLYKNNNLYEQYTLTKEDNWTYTFENLPKYNNNHEENQYSIKELQVLYNGEDITSKFTTTYNGDVIKNIEKVDIPVTKTWNVEDPDNYRVTFVLVKDGVNTTMYSDLITGNGSYTFNNLEKYDGDKQIVYTVKEHKVEHYNGTEWKEVSLDKFTTENTNNNFVNTPKLTITITKSKQWSNIPDGDSTVVIKNTKQSRVIVHYYKKGTGSEYNNSPVAIKEDEVVYVSKGGTYTTTPSITIGDYELTKDETGNYIIPENASGVYTEDEINVYYYYE